MLTSRVGVARVCTLLALACEAPRLGAQASVGLAALVGETTTSEFRRPRGLALSATLFPARILSLRGELAIGEALERRPGPFCVQVEPSDPIFCTGTDTRSRTRLGEFSLTALASAVRTSRVRVQGGVGLSVINVSGQLFAHGGEAAQSAPFRASSTNALFSGMVAARPARSQPVWLYAEYRHYHGVEFRACATDRYTRYAPFCSNPRMYELRAGGTYEWGNRPTVRERVQPPPRAHLSLGISAVAVESNARELRHPRGLGISATLFPDAWVSVRGEIAVARARERRASELCVGGLGQPTTCAGTSTRSESWLREASAAARISIVRTPRVRVQGGVGMAFLNVGGRFIAQGGAPLRYAFAGGSSANPFLTGIIAGKPTRARPLWTYAEYRHQQGVEFKACATDIYSPFCSRPRMHEVRVGVTYDFQRPKGVSAR